MLFGERSPKVFDRFLADRNPFMFRGFVGAKEKMLDLLRKRVGQLVDRDELRKAAGNISEWARGIRYLKQEGWDIETIRGPKGGYRLRSLVKKPGRKREAIDLKTRARILHRDRRTCQMCGRKAPEVKLVVDHKIPVDWEGTNEDSNLWTTCEECNAGKKAYFADFDADIMRQVHSLKTGRERLLEFAKLCKGKEVRPHIFSVVSGVRDWPREIRRLRQDGLIDYTYDKKRDIYRIKNAS